MPSFQRSRRSTLCRALILAAVAFAAWAGPASADRIHPDTNIVTVLPEAPTAGDPIEILFYVTPGCQIFFSAPQILPNGRILIEGETTDICTPPIIPPYFERFVLNPLPAGHYTVDVLLDNRPYRSGSFDVTAADPTLRLQDGRFSVTVHWKNPYGPGEGEGLPVTLSPEAGYFWFFDSDNAEVTVKILDGRPQNGHFWVFIASMTTLELEVTVTECPEPGRPCRSKTYVQPPRQNRNFVDTRF
ncbi:MAG TPA: hypothetical protein VF756_09465 [Thermoanaerobaculia bacterium]